MQSSHWREEADGLDKALCFKMMQMLRSVGDLEEVEPLSLKGFLAGPPPDHVKLRERRLPLTW